MRNISYQDKCMAMGLLFRKLLGVGSTIVDDVNFEYMYDRQPPKTNLSYIKFKVSLRERGGEPLKIEDTKLIEEIKKKYAETLINKQQSLFFNNQSYRFNFEAVELEIHPLGPLNEDEGRKRNLVNFGFLSNNTNIELIS